jgi:Tol biopolymer transport system component
LILLASAIGYALYKFANLAPMISEAKKTTRITASGKVKLAAISPDGKYVTYAQEENGERQSLWTRHIASESAVQIAPPADVQYRGLNVSPDGDQLYYVLGEGSLYQMPVLGGAVKKIADGLYTGPTGQVDIGIAPDGKQIAFVRRFEKEASALFIVNTDGTNEWTLATFEQPTRLGSFVAWSPDGEIIACRAVINGFQNILAVRVADGTSAAVLTPDWVSVLQVAWMPDSKSLLINTLGRGTHQVFYPSGEAHQSAIEAMYSNGFSLTSDGRFLAMIKAELVAHIWTMRSNDASRARQLTDGFEKMDGVLQLSWILNGKIVFNSYLNEASTCMIDTNGIQLQTTS